MADDWRVQVTLRSARAAEELGEKLKAGGVEHDLATAQHERVVVSVDEREKEVFLYAGSRDQAEKAAAVVGSLAADAQTVLRRWHPLAEEWEDPDAPLPGSPAELEAEQRQLAAEEDTESEQLGEPEFEVRIELPSHRETRELQDKLRGEGIPSLRRWQYLLIGTEDEAAAQSLAARLRREVPAGSHVKVEGTAFLARADGPPNPFSVLGGLGG